MHGHTQVVPCMASQTARSAAVQIEEKVHFPPVLGTRGWGSLGGSPEKPLHLRPRNIKGGFGNRTCRFTSAPPSQPLEEPSK